MRRYLPIATKVLQAGLLQHLISEVNYRATESMPACSGDSATPAGTPVQSNQAADTTLLQSMKEIDDKPQTKVGALTQTAHQECSRNAATSAGCRTRSSAAAPALCRRLAMLHPKLSACPIKSSISSVSAVSTSGFKCSFEPPIFVNSCCRAYNTVQHRIASPSNNISNKFVAPPLIYDVVTVIGKQ